MLDEVMNKMEQRQQESLKEIKDELRRLKTHIIQDTPRNKNLQDIMKEESDKSDLNARSSLK